MNGYFWLNSVFAPACLVSNRATVENNCVKTSKDGQWDTYCQRRKSSTETLVSDSILVL